MKSGKAPAGETGAHGQKAGVSGAVDIAFHPNPR